MKPAGLRDHRSQIGAGLVPAAAAGMGSVGHARVLLGFGAIAAPMRS